MDDLVVRTAYFERDPSRLILEAACPALFDLGERSSARGFLRIHWARGPHLDCVISASRADVASGVVDDVGRSIAAWVRDHPSTAVLPPDVADRSRRMAEAEQWPGPIEPLYANNSVAVIANDRPTLWGSRRLWTAAADFHGAALRDVAALVAAKQRSRASFLIAVVRRLAAIGRGSANGDFDFWPLSFSAHARLFLTAHPSLRPTFEDAWERLRKPVAEAVGRIVDARDDPADLAAWTGAATALDAQVRAAQADPDASMTPVDVNNPLHIQETLGGYEQVSSHLHAMFDSRRLAPVFASPLHRRFRIVVNVAYESLACATITPTERALACYLLSRAVIEDFPALATAAGERIRGLADAAHA